jgi:integrase
MRRFSLYPRRKVFYVQFYNPATRRYTRGRSTGQTNRDAAAAVAAEWLRNGIPEPAAGRRRALGELLQVDTIVNAISAAQLTERDGARILEVLRTRGLIETAVVKASPGSEPLISFLEGFWNYEKSPYVRERLAHGQRIGRRHCYDMGRLVRTVWKEYFGGQRPLCEVRKADLAAFSLWLKEQKGWRPKSINTTIAAGGVAFRWARANELTATNPAEGLMHFSGKAAKRGVLTEDEVRQLFAEPWPNLRAYVGNMLAMSTGLRLGEVLAVQVRDVAEDRLHVRHSWSEQDGLKGTKTEEERTVPLLPEVRAALLDVARGNPHGIGPATFVFFSTELPDRPMDAHPLQEELRAALVRLRLPSGDQRKDPAKVQEVVEYWKSRHVVFHSWRHYYAARMSDRLELRNVQTATGHKSAVMAEHYADHATAETFAEVSIASVEAFGKLLPFRKQAT